MTQLHKFPSIEQFRHVVKYVKKYGTHPNGMVDEIIAYRGTVKLHGSNGGVVITPDGDVYAQSRNNVLTLESDNAGFAAFVNDRANKFKWFTIVNHDVVVYGEWCGGNIQKGVGINGLEKMFVIFDAVCIDADGHSTNIFEDIVDEFRISFKDYNDENIYCSTQFPFFNLNIDFNNPEQYVENMTAITQEVENECPVANFFGQKGIGEGVVWTPIYVPEKLSRSQMRFKVKGEKHSVSKVKTLIPLTPEQIAEKNKISSFVDSVVTENRVKQAMVEVDAKSEKQTGDVIRWVFNDIIKEEYDTMEANSIEKKDIGKVVSTKARTIFFGILNDE